MTIRTSILEARCILGPAKLFEDLRTRFDKEIVAKTAREFVAAKLAERETRTSKAGASRYLVEPNVKEGKGGLRDLNTLFWISKYVYRVRTTHELVGAGLFTPGEFNAFRRCEEFLWRVRCQLHIAAGRPEERLSFDYQRLIAERLGYKKRGGLSAVERFMKHYFLIAKTVGDLTAIVCAALEEKEAKPPAVLDRVVGSLLRRPKIDPRQERFLDRVRSRDRRPPRCLHPRPGQHHPFVLGRRSLCVGDPPRCDQARDAVAEAGRRPASRQPGGQSPLPGDPDLADGARDRAAPHERGRRARPLHSGIRPHRRADAVQHVPPLHGGRASAAGRRHPGRDRRGTRARPASARQRDHAQARTIAGRSIWRFSSTTSPRDATRIIPRRGPSWRAIWPAASACPTARSNSSAGSSRTIC